MILHSTSMLCSRWEVSYPQPDGRTFSGECDFTAYLLGEGVDPEGREILDNPHYVEPIDVQRVRLAFDHRRRDWPQGLLDALCPGAYVTVASDYIICEFTMGNGMNLASENGIWYEQRSLSPDFPFSDEEPAARPTIFVIHEWYEDDQDVFTAYALEASAVEVIDKRDDEHWIKDPYCDTWQHGGDSDPYCLTIEEWMVNP